MTLHSAVSLRPFPCHERREAHCRARARTGTQDRTNLYAARLPSRSRRSAPGPAGSEVSAFAYSMLASVRFRPIADISASQRTVPDTVHFRMRDKPTPFGYIRKMDTFVSSHDSKIARDPSVLDRLLVTLDVDVQSFALCQVERGRRLIGEAVDAIMVQRAGRVHQEKDEGLPG